MKRLPTDYFTVENQFKNPASFFDVHWWKKTNTCYHTHADFYELFFTTIPNYIHFYKDESTVLPAYTLCLLPPGSCHQLLCGDCGSNADGLSHFNLSISKIYFDNFLLQNAFLLKGRSVNEAIIFTMDKNEYSFIRYLAKQLTYKATETTDCQKIVSMILINSLLFSMGKSPETNVSNPLKQNEIPAQIIELKEKLDHYELMDCPIQSIYTKIPFSPPIIIENFKKLTGKTIIEYRTIKRIQQAELLLSNTDYSVLEISNKVGYYSLSHFIKNFKAATTHTPEAYRKQHSSTSR